MNLTPQLAAKAANIQALFRAQAAEALAQNPDAQAFGEIARGIEKKLAAPRRALERLHSKDMVEMSLRFGMWADQQGCKPSISAIREYLGCCKATAYRYLRSYRAARGEA